MKIISLSALKDVFRRFIISLHAFLFESHYKQVSTLLEPNILGLKKRAFGKDGDGTYILPIDIIENNSNFTLLSFGISNDISFEKDFRDAFPLINIYAFDPTIHELPETNTGIAFYKMGLGGKDSIKRNIYSLDTIFNKLKLTRQKKFILKIDIEGWEWGFLSEFNFDSLDVKIITIELHFLPLTSKKETLLLPLLFYWKLKVLKKMLKNFYIFHIHANNYHYITFSKFRFPTYLELTLVNKKRFITKISDEITQYNKPSIPGKQDFQFPFRI